MTTDGGGSWSPVVADAASFLDAFRVLHLSRRPSGELAIAGIQTGGDHRVVGLDTEAFPPALQEIFVAGDESWSRFTAGSYAELRSGLAVAESLTGTDVAFRPDSPEPWESGYGWWHESGLEEGQQILDLAAPAASRLWVDRPAAGVSPNQGARPLWVRGGVPATGFDSYRGELWSLDVDGGHRGGGEPGGGNGLRLGSRPYRVEDWRPLDASTVVLDSDEPTWIRGVCRAGADLVAVGEYSRLGEGIVLRSRDNGLSWSDETAGLGQDVPALQRCQVFSDGTVVVAGADGFFARS